MCQTPSRLRLNVRDQRESGLFELGVSGGTPPGDRLVREAAGKAGAVLLTLWGRGGAAGVQLRAPGPALHWSPPTGPAQGLRAQPRPRHLPRHLPQHLHHSKTHGDQLEPGQGDQRHTPCSLRMVPTENQRPGPAPGLACQSAQPGSYPRQGLTPGLHRLPEARMQL